MVADESFAGFVVGNVGRSDVRCALPMPALSQVVIGVLLTAAAASAAAVLSEAVPAGAASAAPPDDPPPPHPTSTAAPSDDVQSHAAARRRRDGFIDMEVSSVLSSAVSGCRATVDKRPGAYGLHRKIRRPLTSLPVRGVRAARRAGRPLPMHRGRWSAPHERERQGPRGKLCGVIGE